MDISDDAKTILCYGDSITWGRIPGAERYPRSKRWTTILQKLLGNEYEIIVEGLPGRTFATPDNDRPYKNGISSLKGILRSHRPIDAVLVMLGTNDTKGMYKPTLESIGNGLEQTIEMIQGENIKHIFVICPPKIILPKSGLLVDDFSDGLGIELTKQFPEMYKSIAEKHSCYFINSQEHVSTSEVDGVHLDEEANQKLAEVIKEEILSKNI